MRLVRQPNRRNWYIAWTENRRTKLKSTGCTDKSDARAVLDAYRKGEHKRSDRVGCSALINRYLDARKDVMDYERLINAAKPLKVFFAEIRAENIGPETCRDYANWRGKAPGTMRRELAVLRSALSLAGYVQKLWLPDRVLPKTKYLSREEAFEACTHMSWHIRLFTQIALATGQRKTSILQLTWDRADLERMVLDFERPGRRRTKKRTASVPIGKQLASVLRDAKQTAETDFVIEYNGKPIKNIRKGFDRAMERAGFPWCTPHTLKHTAISWMAEGGYTVDQISDLTGTDADTVKRIYRKFNPDYLRGLADHMDGELFDGIKPVQSSFRPTKRPD